LTVILIL